MLSKPSIDSFLSSICLFLKVLRGWQVVSSFVPLTLFLAAADIEAGKNNKFGFYVTTWTNICGHNSLQVQVSLARLIDSRETSQGPFT